jgi:hypothetical protein
MVVRCSSVLTSRVVRKSAWPSRHIICSRVAAFSVLASELTCPPYLLGRRKRRGDGSLAEAGDAVRESCVVRATHAFRDFLIIECLELRVAAEHDDKVFDSDEGKILGSLPLGDGPPRGIATCRRVPSRRRHR